MRDHFLENEEDVAWLKTTHLKGVPLPEKWSEFKTAILQGNEDAPHAVNLYIKEVPSITDNFLRVEFIGDGLTYAEYQEYDGSINKGLEGKIPVPEEVIEAAKKQKLIQP